MDEVEETAGEVLEVAVHGRPGLHQPCAGPERRVPGFSPVEGGDA